MIKTKIKNTNLHFSYHAKDSGHLNPGIEISGQESFFRFIISFALERTLFSATPRIWKFGSTSKIPLLRSKLT